LKQALGSNYCPKEKKVDPRIVSMTIARLKWDIFCELVWNFSCRSLIGLKLAALKFSVCRFIVG
jgi:hypothetical protein